MVYLITGGSGSGKSAWAEELAERLCREMEKETDVSGSDRKSTCIYLATMRVWDEEGKRRVERHRNMRRDKGFQTVERETDLDGLVLPGSCRGECSHVILLECMSNLVVNEFYEQEKGAKERILTGINHLQNQCRNLIIVTNEIFSDGITYDPESERYLALLGAVNQELAARADVIAEIVYGIPVFWCGECRLERG